MRINISSNTWNGYTAENQEERIFFNETAFLFWCHALWKLGSSNCCIFEMKHAMGLKTCKKINFLIIFNLVLIRIRKPRYFDFSLLMTSLWKPSIVYKITKKIRALWLAERGVCMRVCKHDCGVKMFCFSHANNATTNLKKFSSSKLDKFTLFTQSSVGWNLEIRYKEGVSIFFSLQLTV